MDKVFQRKRTNELSTQDTKYVVELYHDLDAIFEYAKQEGFITTCDQHSKEESFHFHNVKSVDEIIELAVKQGFFEFYESNGTCYRLTKKGLKRFEH